MGTRVFVGGLKDPRLRERDIENFFKGYGRLREVVVKPGYAFVEFEDLRDAEDAVYEKNGKSLNGDRVVVEHAMRPGSVRGNNRRPRSPMFRSRLPPPSRSKYRVGVENVSSRASWRDLKAFMAKAGEVTFCDVHRHVSGEGHCEFETRQGMEKALDELDGRELHGKRLKLKEERSRSRSPRRRGFGSGSRRRSKSGSRSKSRSQSKSRSPDKDKDKGKDKDDESKSRSRSKSPAKKKSRSPARKSRKSRSRSRSKSRSKSKSPAKERSRTRSATPARKNAK